MKALLIIDVQNDFLPGGALEVEDGDAIIPVINRIQRHYDFIVATQDWHPANHKSFAVNHPGKSEFEIIKMNGGEQVLWPVHCVQNTYGAEFSKDLDTSKIGHIIQKGMHPEIDSYSGFYDNAKGSDTGLANLLKKNKVREIHICGIAGDFCVAYTVNDALDEGFYVGIIEEAVRSIDPKTFEKYRLEWKGKNVAFI